MGLFDRMKEPVFLKESSNAEVKLENLKALEPLLNSEGQARLRQDIKCIQYGIAGEKNIAFELKNSHMPMYILHDIYLEDGDLSAQIDYLVFTKKNCFVIECKNLYGNIEINSEGDFVRTMEIGGRMKREGIYSPITQNRHHLELMKKIKMDQNRNIFTRSMVERYFENINKSLVVLANPKTVLEAKYAKKEVKEKVIRSDQLVNYIKEIYDQSNESELSDGKLLAWAEYYLDLHKEAVKDDTKEYARYLATAETADKIVIPDYVPHLEKKSNIVSEPSVEETDLYKELKAYRLAKSCEEKIKPYFIYNNNQLLDLIQKMPGNKEELLLVAGFGAAKAEKYGDDILTIVRKYGMK